MGKRGHFTTYLGWTILRNTCGLLITSGLVITSDKMLIGS